MPVLADGMTAAPMANRQTIAIPNSLVATKMKLGTARGAYAEYRSSEGQPVQKHYSEY